jgi:hypothetical protein
VVPPPRDLVELVGRAREFVRAHTRDIDPLLPFTGRDWQPIPFFGRLESATVITVAMNPSGAEFSPERRWRADMSAAEIAERLHGYFLNTQPPPYGWFREKCEAPTLRGRGLTFGNGGLAHVDALAIPTKPPTPIKEPLLALAKRMDWTMFEALKLATNARVFVVTGSLTGSYDLHRWIAERGASYGVALDRKPERPSGGDFAAPYVVSFSDGRKVPMLFTSRGPSFWKERKHLHFHEAVQRHDSWMTTQLSEAR